MTTCRALAKSLAALTALWALAFVLLAPGLALALPEAHILRIDPRASTTDGAPVLTSVIEVVQNKRLSDITTQCRGLTGNAYYDCASERLDQPGALYQTFDFPEKNALFTTLVDNAEVPAKFVSKSRWGESLSQPGVGTAWLIVLDGSSSMGSTFDDAKAVASAFVSAMGPNDIVNVILIDRTVIADSKWKANKAEAAQFVASLQRSSVPATRSRPLGTAIKQAITDGFGELGNVGTGVTVPLHQALVVLSNGAAGTDPDSTPAHASVISKYATDGRFPENNTQRPKMPVPIISILFPKRTWEELSASAGEFMQNLANPQIGGYFNVVRDGGAARGPSIVNAVRTRFNRMWIVKWQVSCVQPTSLQTFRLNFLNVTTPIQGENWDNVPVGIDPTVWPLAVDREATERAAKKNPAHPGGTVKIFGDFCWGGNKGRAELYMIPKNQQPVDSLKNTSIQEAKDAQQKLIAQGMRGKAVETGDGYVEFELPDTEKFLVGSGDKMVARLVIYDNVAKRTSPITSDKIITLKASKKPLPLLWIGLGSFAAVVLVLLVVSVLRGGSGKRRGGGSATPPAPPRPIVAGPAPVAPPADFLYGGAPPPPNPSAATVQGVAGHFRLMPGQEMRAGRDGAACQILLSEPRVSGTHATLRFEGGQLLVRDEGSQNGTWVSGQRIPPHVFTPVPHGSQLRFGPVEFAVRLE